MLRGRARAVHPESKGPESRMAALIADENCYYGLEIASSFLHFWAGMQQRLALSPMLPGLPMFLSYQIPIANEIGADAYAY